eukprot:m.104313 g.104313  ORF g.104313 m.104313 type:complete len:73 (+) comp20931_c0_seq1:1897-2115(+)
MLDASSTHISDSVTIVVVQGSVPDQGKGRAVTATTVTTAHSNNNARGGIGGRCYLSSQRTTNRQPKTPHGSD